MILTQIPAPGSHLLRHCGDTLEIILKCSQKTDGEAFLSTNVGNAVLRRSEIIKYVEEREPVSGQDWANLKMNRVDDYTFQICLALQEEGHFEAKACIIQNSSGVPVWVNGSNIHINVEPSSYAAGNSIYCAFVRQFGKNKNKLQSENPPDITNAEIEKFDSEGYTVIPESGTFRGLIQELPHIIEKLKCRIIHLLPINPTPTVFARMGRFGSPYASLDFTSVDPQLAEFDKKATPLDQFRELADAIHQKQAKLFIDIAINHTGWASKLQEDHPDWFVREQNGEIHSPGAWGVVWGDLAELDHTKYDLWKYLAEVFLTWCSRGVDGFRCDAGYMIPENAWKYIIALVRDVYPSTVFLLEGLGGAPSTTTALLDKSNMNWAYSELFQNYSKEQVEGYLNYAWEQSSKYGTYVHYAETHDNNRLAAVSEKYAMMRTALSALTSVSGAFGFANGVEWFAKQKIDVHEASGLNWGTPKNQISLISRLNTILAVHPAFFNGAECSFRNGNQGGSVLFVRSSSNRKDRLLIAVNLDCEHSADLFWNQDETSFSEKELTDLISGDIFDIADSSEYRKRHLSLLPGQFVCFTNDSKWLSLITKHNSENKLYRKSVNYHQACAAVLRAVIYKNNSVCLNKINVDEMVEKLLDSPEKFIQSLYPETTEAKVIVWDWRYDGNKSIVLTRDQALIVRTDAPFRLEFRFKDEILLSVDSINSNDNLSFAIFHPPEITEDIPRFASLHGTMRVFHETHTECLDIEVFFVPKDCAAACTSYPRQEIFRMSRVFLQSNGCGAIIHQPLEIGNLESRYDAVLLANLNPEYPEDRHIMFRRIRLWVGYRARLQVLKNEQIQKFYVAEDGSGIWEYNVPVGNGYSVRLSIQMKLIEGRNAVQISFFRLSGKNNVHCLDDDQKVNLIISADIEDRNFHCSTKASQGPEYNWPNQIQTSPKGFEFAPWKERILSVYASKGCFIRKDEWMYMIHQIKEEQRGLDPYSDLYSPGLFQCMISGNDGLSLAAEVRSTPDSSNLIPPYEKYADIPKPFSTDLESIMIHSMRNFVVKRNQLKTVIAGYPWFLDWGRDTLISARGLISNASFRGDVRKILLQFSSFEENGTIPNMISGQNASNRDTSDAPLWLFTAVADYCKAEGNMDFIYSPVRKDQNLRDILESIAEGYRKGTPNGIKQDTESGLVFSPAHFTWMDTNYPAGTPREGYPIEIQALWFAALIFLHHSFVNDNPQKQQKWFDEAEKVRHSILRYYTLPGKLYLSDCLHCSPGTSAQKAVPDDHLRPNQLFAITLGAVTDPACCRNILSACRELIVPGAIRTLAARNTEYQLPVCGANGTLLNNPTYPYFGRYEGNEDTNRKPAYHNGTAWTWPFPSYCEAYYLCYGESGINTARVLLSSMIPLLENGCVMNLPEIIDGDFPHTARGCDAQAWGITEMYRVWKLLHKN